MSKRWWMSVGNYIWLPCKQWASWDVIKQRNISRLYFNRRGGGGTNGSYYLNAEPFFYQHVYNFETLKCLSSRNDLTGASSHLFWFPPLFSSLNYLFLYRSRGVITSNRTNSGIMYGLRSNCFVCEVQKKILCQRLLIMTRKKNKESNRLIYLEPYAFGKQTDECGLKTEITLFIHSVRPKQIYPWQYFEMPIGRHNEKCLTELPRRSQ